MFAVDNKGITPFDEAPENALLEMYGVKLAKDHGRLALHAILDTAEYSFTDGYVFRSPMNPIRMILPQGKISLEHFRTLPQHVGLNVIRSRDDSGKLPIHVACW